ncbi:NAD-dependent epimerase/dehydratase family protein [Nocardioides alcanivorans]|uniref:NAD-dependent epimerase/dehydratase family protein n=1 Tax=Nocardioides alcanivorans TaxID=2897352 RepID=UPI001F279250|nr:NAD-dependent epimerase/dehydratase family protein [Nocardioides alcanivorans]
MRILVLGGTGWLGRTIARTAVAAGNHVTCLARGETGGLAEGVRFVRADRADPGAYASVAVERWQAVIDVARHPGHVRSAVAALSGSTERWAFVSTGNVYADHSTLDADEAAPLLDPLVGDVMASMEEYGAAKVACEQAVLAGLGERAVVARSGLIGGPGDESGRSGYWPRRFAHPSNPAAEVLVPAADLPTSLIDVRDLAAWLVAAVTGDELSGTFDAIANRVTLAEHLETAREVAGHVGPLVAASDGWLAQQGVEEWSGPTSLPLWLRDPDWRAFAGRSGAKILRSGLQPRPLRETLADTLAWEESRTPTGWHGAGLTDAEELELLASYHGAP